MLASIWTLAATGVVASQVTVGDPLDPGGLPGAILQAHALGARDIQIRPGIYQIPSINHQDTIVLDGWEDTIIRAAGVTLVFQELDHRPVHLEHCARVTWAGGVMMFVHPSFTQGRVIATGSNAKGCYYDWKIDESYPANIDPRQSTFDAVDKLTRVLKVNTQDWGPTSYDWKWPATFRLYYPAGHGAGVLVNDWLVTRAPGGSSIIQLDECTKCTLRDVTLENAGFAAFFETGGMGANRYLNCKIQPGPRPPGAAESELVGCGADGFHSVNTETGPDIEDCTFSGVFLDDCIAIHGTFDRVLSSNGNDVIVGSAHPMPKAGDQFRIADMKGFFADAKVQSAKSQPDGTVRVTLDKLPPVPIDHSQDGDPKKGTKACDPGYCGRGYRILRCRLGNTRSRGILVKADDGIIDHCVIAGTGMSGVSIGPEFWWNEGGYCSNVTVSNSEFIECNKNNGDQSAVWVHGDGAMGNRGITIRGNTFDNCYGRSVMRIDWTAGASLLQNTIVGALKSSPNAPGHVFWLDHSKDVRISGNATQNEGLHAEKAVGAGAEIKTGDTAPIAP